MYSEGSSMEAISRVMGVKAGTVYSWVKKVRWAWETMQLLSRQRKMDSEGQGAAKVISLDEMWTYVGVRRRGIRRDVWVWTAVVEEENGRRWVDEVGDRTEATFLKLYNRLPEAEQYHTDAYRVYGWLPANRHVIGKGGAVNRNEGLHSVLRGKLNRLIRRAKGYSKSVAMLCGSIALVCLRLGLI